MVDLVITPENFASVKHRISIVKSREFFRDYDYIKPKTFADLGSGEICIDLSDISHKTLGKLHTKIGMRKGNKFIYQNYDELYREYRTNKEGGGTNAGIETGLY